MQQPFLSLSLSPAGVAINPGWRSSVPHFCFTWNKPWRRAWSDGHVWICGSLRRRPVQTGPARCSLWARQGPVATGLWRCNRINFYNKVVVEYFWFWCISQTCCFRVFKRLNLLLIFLLLILEAAVLIRTRFINLVQDVPEHTTIIYYTLYIFNSNCNSSTSLLDRCGNTVLDQELLASILLLRW